MIEEREVRQLLSDLFEEQALVIGGLVATHHVGDAAVWSLMRAFDAIRHRALSRVECPAHTERYEDRGEPQVGRHPALEEYLRKVEACRD